MDATGDERASGPTPDINLNLNVRGMRPSATVAINELSNEMRAAGKKVYKLGLGQSPFPVPASVVTELQVNAYQKDYLQVVGLRELREAVASYHQRRQGIPARADHVLIGPGSKELMFLLQLVYYGELVVPTPAWVSYAPQAAILGRKVSFLHTRKDENYRLSAALLEGTCRSDPNRPRILVMNYPSNPHGGSYQNGDLEELAEVAKKYKVVVLSDEIYGELHHDGRYVSIAQYYPEGTIVSSGLSKWCGAGGWRLGTFTFPESMRWLRHAMAVAASETYTSTSAPIQYAAVRAFQSSLDLENYLFHSRRILAALGRWCAEQLNEAGIATCMPDGGFYLFPCFDTKRPALADRGIRGSAELCHRLLEDTGVAILPGSDFGRNDEELSVRLAYVNFDGARAITASEAIPKDQPLSDVFVKTWCKGTVAAIEKICAWANAEGERSHAR